MIFLLRQPNYTCTVYNVVLQAINLPKQSIDQETLKLKCFRDLVVIGMLFLSFHEHMISDNSESSIFGPPDGGGSTNLVWLVLNFLNHLVVAHLKTGPVTVNITYFSDCNHPASFNNDVKSLEFQNFHVILKLIKKFYYTKINNKWFMRMIIQCELKRRDIY